MHVPDFYYERVTFFPTDFLSQTKVENKLLLCKYYYKLSTAISFGQLKIISTFTSCIIRRYIKIGGIL
ncbi:hypothetical protein AGMMS50262_14030 [Bacteroidia bacterium]|nr:hypothetical protein AGMMS50262_14030 [Bacteroidia bacterium]